MLYKKCACGCGKWIAVKHKNHMYYDPEHRRRHLYSISTNKENPAKEKAKTVRKLSPGQRWEAMSLVECSREALRLGISYGKLQSMYYNNLLPKDFGIKILEERGKTK